MEETVTRQNKLNLGYLGLIVLGAAARLMPHPPNFTPTGSIAFFSGNKLKGAAVAYLVPLAILFLSDLVIGWHNTMLYVYGSFILSAALGHWMQGGPAKKFAGLTLSSLIFFGVTNFGVWLGSGMYPQTGSGLIACYTAALPFLANDLAANLIYGGAFFAIASMLERKTIAVSAAV